ncbi:glutamyl aminopeptidase-like [Centruroides sculpturatus]|uniref:glutamyl aminopeptidase-like n=1 Tax=Centruroides sculpturatus TaxID=218467 RepID=UPI000C6E2E8F|nr:glutamyl aminopeptidase-like [Centruroides sculpturatus]
MASAATRSKTKVYLLGLTVTELTGNLLPTLQQALGLLLHHHLQLKQTIRQSSAVIVEKLAIFYEMARIPMMDPKNCITKLLIERTFEEWCLLKKNKRRQSVTQQTNKTEFVFSAVDRAGLIDDIFMLSRAGILHASYIFDVVKYLKNEKEYAPWKIALSHFHDLLMLLEDDSHLLLIQNYFSSILASIITEFSDWNEEESNQMIKLRTSVFLSALKIENVDIIQKSIQMFQNWMDRDEPC